MPAPYTDPNAKPWGVPQGGSGSGNWVYVGGRWQYYDQLGKQYIDPKPGDFSVHSTTQKPDDARTSSSVTASDGVGAAAGPGGYSPDAIEGLHKPAPTDNPFGNEMPDVQQSYTPFGLGAGSAFSGYGGGSPSGGYSYLSDQLTPSLEQRRMGMLSQMMNPQQGGR